VSTHLISRIVRKEKLMAETVQERINQYLKDTIAAERNFEKALSTFSQAGEQTPVQSLMSFASARAKTQHERLEALLKSRGASPSEGKTILAEMLAFTPLSAQIGQGAAEKNTQHLMVTFAAAAAEMAMYESLATAGAQGAAEDVVALARTLQGEERDDYDKVWGILKQSAADSFQAEIEKGKTSQEVLARYLEDAIAAEKSFETQLLGFSKEVESPTVQAMFRQHAEETRQQYTMLTQRLEEMGGSTSSMKGFLAHMFNFAPKVAQIGHDKYERQTQDLMMAFAVENAEVAMYEALAHAAQLAGDTRTEALARQIQEQEKQTAEKVWAQVAPAARRAMQVVSEAA
jgi:ferritin-like metal-binding protein YciE